MKGYCAEGSALTTRHAHSRLSRLKQLSFLAFPTKKSPPQSQLRRVLFP